MEGSEIQIEWKGGFHFFGGGNCNSVVRSRSPFAMALFTLELKIVARARRLHAHTDTQSLRGTPNTQKAKTRRT